MRKSLNWIFNKVCPPGITDEDQLRISMIITTIATAVLIGVLLVLPKQIYADKLRNVIALLLLLSSMLASLYFLHRKLISIAGNLILISLLVFLSFLILFNDGLKDTAFFAFPGLMVAAGLIYTKRNYIIFIAITLLIFPLVGYLEINGIVKTPYSESTHFGDILDMIVILGITAILIRILLNDMMTYINKHRKSEKELLIKSDILSKSEKRFKALFEGTRDPILLLNEKSEFIDCNESAVKFFGFNRKEEIIGKNPGELSPEYQKDGTSSFDLANEIIKNAFHLNDQLFEWEHTKKDDSRLFVEVALRFIQIEDENILLAHLRDITERKISEFILRESEERFSKAFQSSPAPLAITEIETGVYIDVNEQWIRTFKFNREEVIGKSSVDIGIYKDKSVRENTVKKIIADGRLEKYPIQFRNKQGNLIEAFWSAEIISLNGRNVLLSLIFDYTEQKIAGEKLKFSEEKFRSIIQGLSDMVIIVDNNGKLSYQSPSVYRRLGYTPEEMNGRSPMEFIHPEDIEIASSELSKVFVSENEGLPTLYRAKQKNGSYIYMEAVGINMLNNEFVNGVVIFGRDVTERINAERALKDSEKRFGDLIYNIQDPVFLLSFEGKIIFANPACYKMVQLDETTNLEGIHFTQFMTETEIKKGYRDLEEVEKTGGPFNAEYEIITTKGEIRWIDTTGLRINFQGEPVNLITVKDVTERKISQNILSYSEKRFKSVWENTLDAMRLTDSEGTIVLVNQAYCDLVHKSRRELEGDRLSIVFIEKLREQVQKDYFENFKNKSLKPKYETELELWNDMLVYVEVAHTFLTIPEQPELLLTVFHNISDRKKAEDELRLSEEKYRMIVENQNDLVVKVDTEGNFLYVSPSYCKLFGKSESDLLGKPFIPLIHPDDVDITNLAMQNLFREPYSCYVEQRAMTFDGWRWLAWSDQAVLDDKGEVISIIGVARDITERKLTEEALSTSQNLLQNILNTIPVRVFWKDINLTYLGCNKSFAADAGLDDPDEIIGKNDYMMGWKEQADLYRDDDLKVIHSGLPKLNYEEPQTTPDGRTIYLRTSKIPLKNDKGEIFAVLGSYEDITERKKAEEELAKSEEMYRTLVSTVPDFILRTDLNGNVVFLNEKSFPSIKNLPAERFLGKNIFQFISPQDRQRALENFKIMFDEFLGPREYTLNFDDGVSIICEVNGDVVRNDKGNPVEVVYVIRDVTERKQAEELIRIKSENFKRIFDLAPYGMLITENTEESKILDVNRAHLELTEMGSDELIGKSSFEFILNEDRIRLSGMLTTYGKVLDYELRFRTKSGKIKTLLLSSSLIEYDNKSCVLSVFKDITEQKQTETELDNYRHHLEELIKERTGELENLTVKLQEEIVKQKEAEAKVKEALVKEKELSDLKTRFISIASHEFRTPLATMYSSTELLELFYTSNSTEKFNAQIERIRSNIKNLTEIMDDVLVISRADSGKINYQPSHVHLQSFIEKIVEDAQVLLTAKHHLNFTNSYQEDMVYLDEKLSRIILMNLISNAIKYSPEGGEIKLEIFKYRNNLSIRLTDNGIGIPEKDQKHLFEPFHRADNVGPIHGTGLGLTIVQKYIELHGGKIKVNSKPGEGTTFTISIPQKNNIGV